LSWSRRISWTLRVDPDDGERERFVTVSRVGREHIRADGALESLLAQIGGE